MLGKGDYVDRLVRYNWPVGAGSTCTQPLDYWSEVIWAAKPSRSCGQAVAKPLGRLNRIGPIKVWQAWKEREKVRGVDICNRIFTYSWLYKKEYLKNFLEIKSWKCWARWLKWLLFRAGSSIYLHHICWCDETVCWCDETCKRCSLKNYLRNCYGKYLEIKFYE